MFRNHSIALVFTVTLGAPAAFADAGTSLNTCQKTVAAASAQYVRAVADRVGKCLAPMSTAVVKKGRTTAEAATSSAGACVTSFRKLLNSDAPAKTLGARFDAKFDAKCDPAANPKLQHVEAATYTVGNSTLGAANLSAYCATLGGDDTLDSFAEWRTCLHAAADREARAAIMVRWPRALEYFEALRTAMSALPANTKTTDALTALTALDSAIEGPIDDNVPDPPSRSTGLLTTGQVLCPDAWSPAVEACPFGLPDNDGIARAGFEARYHDNADGTITDEITGLTWEKLSSDATIHSQLDAYTFASINAKIATLNLGGGFAGHTDWRLPNRRELQSLVDFGRFDPAIRSVFDDNCVAGCSVLECSCTLAEPYWSSTSYQPDASQRWVVDFFHGRAIPSSAATARVRAVRGGTTAGLGAGTPSADPPPSLNTCQKAVAAESTKYIGAVTGTLGKCLNAMSTAVIKKGATPTTAAQQSASTCLTAFATLNPSAAPETTSGGQFMAKVAAKCDPSVNPQLSHLDADTYVVGKRTLSAARLGAYCASLGGDSPIDSFGKWSGCLRRAADAAAREAIALRWPRALEYFAALRTAIASLPVSVKQSDALAALAALDAELEGATDDDTPDPPPAPPAGLLVTGQTQCAQGDLSMGACPGGLPGQDGAIRAGIPLSYTDNGDGTITDTVTGLMWEKLSDDDSIHDRDHDYTGIGAFLNKVARLNYYNYAGYSDWRVPNVRELESLVDAGRASPAIDPMFNHDCAPGCSVLDCSCTPPTAALSSTTTPIDARLQLVDFTDGAIGAGAGGSVRAVRAGNQPPHPYVNQLPVPLPFNVFYPWQQECNPITLWAFDRNSTLLWARITRHPTNGFLTEFGLASMLAGADTPIAAAQPDVGPMWTPLGFDSLLTLMPSYSPTFGSYHFASTLCYVPFSPTFVGTDQFAYEVVDNERAVSSSPGIVNITVLEVP